jgi:hypothetical protein
MLTGQQQRLMATVIHRRGGRLTMAHGVHLRSAVSNRRCPVQHPDRHADDRVGGQNQPCQPRQNPQGRRS